MLQVPSLLLKYTYIFLCLSISALRSSSSFLCFSSRAFLLLSVLPKMSMRSGGEAALSLRDEAVVDRERERDSLRRFLFDSRDLDRFFDLSLSLDRDRERLRFLLCLLLLECLDREELRLRERPMFTTSTSTYAKLLCLLADMRAISGMPFHPLLFKLVIYNNWPSGIASTFVFWKNNHSTRVVILSYQLAIKKDGG